MALLLLVGCGWAPSAGLGDLEVRELTMTGATADLTVDIDNPWPVGTTVGTRWELAVRDEVIAQGEAPPTELVASGPTELTIPVVFTWAELWRAAGGSDIPSPYRATLSVTGEGPFGTWTLPIVHEGELPPVRLPSLDALGVRIDEVSLVRWKLTLLARVDVPIDALTWAISVGTQQLVHGSVDRAEGQVELPVALELHRGFEAARTLLAAGVGAGLSGRATTPLGEIPLVYQRRWSVAAALGLAPSAPSP